MKYLKNFEINNNKTISIGNYVLMNYKPSHKLLINLSEFINNTIGVVINVSDDRIYVKYYNIPIKLKHFFKKINNNEDVMSLYYNDIIYFANTKEELEFKISTNKYNL
jgi:hypothetical protein